ncbi:MAG TPA: DUF58 domain-containing protein, partial [Nocardioides sp.]|nr:DUF58 domain-containing protein [Nocardioides sp.]
ERHAPLAAAGAAEDATVREYRRGDDLRRVHWRSSARVGELMVRREEHPWEARATVLVDDRESAHAGHGPTSSLETAVVIAASVAEHLDQRGYAVRLATSAGLVESGTDQLSLLLEHLAVLGLRRRASLDVGWHDEPGRSGIVVGIFGNLTGDDALPLRRLRQGAAIAAGFALDTSQWAGHGAGRTADNESARALRDQGWRAVPMGRATSVESAWRDLAASAEVRR